MTLETREHVAELAIELVGGVDGYTKEHDPFGVFALVTEGRQLTWIDKATGKKRSYSACQDLLSRILLSLCEFKQGMPWCNRVDGGNEWIPGQNLIRIKRHAAYAWRTYEPGTDWDIQLGDGVEVDGKYGPHTFVVAHIEYDAEGEPVAVDAAEYGQFIDPDGTGPEHAGHGCRLRVDAPVGRDSFGRWTVGGAAVIGRVDVMAIRDRELPEIHGT